MSIKHEEMSRKIEEMVRSERLKRLRAAMKALGIGYKLGAEVGSIPVGIAPDGSIDDGGDAVEHELWQAYGQCSDLIGLTLDERINLAEHSIAGSDLDEREFFDTLLPDEQAHYLKFRLGVLLELEPGDELSPNVVPVAAIYKVARFKNLPKYDSERGEIELHMTELRDAGLPFPEILTIHITNRQERRFSADDFVPGEHLEIRGLNKWGFCFWRKINI